MTDIKKREPLLKVEHLKKYFPLTKGFFGKTYAWVKAVDDISFNVNEKETFGLVGESGCGKTTVGKSILRVLRPTGGKIYYNEKEISSISKDMLKTIRRELQLIFQDPYSSLDPRQSVFSILKEAIVSNHMPHSSEEIKRRVDELLTLVELNLFMSYRYPHEMSGGQRQRLGIARALACNPKLIVCDEPVSALDVSIQAQIINLLKNLEEKLGLTYLFIAHDLAVVRNIANRIGIMYLGKIVEIIDADEIFYNSMHPYTKALLSAVPTTDYYIEKKSKRIILKGEVPSPINAPSGCPFHPRCSYATDECKKTIPQLINRGGGHRVACHNI